MIRVERQLPRKSRIISPVSAGGDERLRDHAGDGRVDEHRLVPDRRDMDAWAAGCGDPWQQRLDAGDDVERGGRPRLQDRHQHRALAVTARCWSAAGAVVHVSHIAHIDDRAVDLLIGRSFSRAISFGLALSSTLYSNVPIFSVPAGTIRFCADGIDDIVRRQALRPQRLRLRSTWIWRTMPPIIIETHQGAVTRRAARPWRQGRGAGAADARCA